jgi:hypothetical protein
MWSTTWCVNVSRNASKLTAGQFKRSQGRRRGFVASAVAAGIGAEEDEPGRMGSPSPAENLPSVVASRRESVVKLLQSVINLATERARVAGRGDGGPQPVLSIKSRAKGLAAAP